MEKILNSLYQQIAETVNEMIQEDWLEFYFYAQISDDGGGIYFFYLPETNPERYEYSLEIPFKYQVNEREFKLNKRKLLLLAEQMRDIFKDNGQELWVFLYFKFRKDRKIKSSL